MAKVQSVLSDDKNDWEHRVAAVSFAFCIFFGVSSKQNQIDHNSQSEQRRNHREPIRSKSKTSNYLRRGKTPVTHVTIGYDFASDWLKGWREFSRPIMK